MPTPEYLAAERARNTAKNNRENLWLGVAVLLLTLLIWACGGAAALL